MILSPLKPPLSFPTLTSSIVTFNAQYALPLKSHKIALTATQSGSGTPSPDNVRTINGYNAINTGNYGENLFDASTLVNGYLDANGVIQGSGVSSVTEFYEVSNGDSVFYFYDTLSATADRRICIYDSSKTVIDSVLYNNDDKRVIFTINNANAKYVRFTVGRNFTNQRISIGQYVTIQIGSTVYGGTYNAITGILTVTHGFVTYDSNNVPFMQIGTISGGVKTRVFIRQSGVSQTVSGVPDMLCNIADPVEVNAQYQGNEGISIRVNANVNNQGFYIYNEDIQTLTEWQDYINNNSITVVYPLATPQTIQLPPCPIDTIANSVNNIWADTGDTTLQYPKFG